MKFRKAIGGVLRLAAVIPTFSGPPSWTWKEIVKGAKYSNMHENNSRSTRLKVSQYNLLQQGEGSEFPDFREGLCIWLY